MKYIKTFENSNIFSKFKVGDYVYPKEEHCHSQFQVLKPKKYKIERIYKQYGEYWFELEDIDSIHMNQFDPDWFMTEIEYNQNKYNF